MTTTADIRAKLAADLFGVFVNLAPSTSRPQAQEQPAEPVTGGFDRSVPRRSRCPKMTEAERQEALARAREGHSDSNIPLIVAGFVAKGIPESEIKPRENVLTYAAWQALDRQVRRGEHGVKIPVVIEREETDPETGEKKKLKFTRTVTVFHVSQTEAVN